MSRKIDKGDTLFSRMVKRVRLETGLSQTEFAREFDVDIRNWQRWEQGHEPQLSVLIEVVSGLPLKMRGAFTDMFYPQEWPKYDSTKVKELEDRYKEKRAKQQTTF